MPDYYILLSVIIWCFLNNSFTILLLKCASFKPVNVPDVNVPDDPLVSGSQKQTKKKVLSCIPPNTLKTTNRQVKDINCVTKKVFFCFLVEKRQQLVIS